MSWYLIPISCHFSPLAQHPLVLLLLLPHLCPKNCFKKGCRYCTWHLIFATNYKCLQDMCIKTGDQNHAKPLTSATILHKTLGAINFFENTVNFFPSVSFISKMEFSLGEGILKSPKSIQLKSSITSYQRINIGTRAPCWICTQLHTKINTIHIYTWWLLGRISEG